MFLILAFRIPTIFREFPMFGSFLKAATDAVRSIASSPQDMAAIAMAFDRYRDCGEFLVTDSLLESRIAPALMNCRGVEEVAVFGFSDHLRLSLRAMIAGQSVEATLKIAPTAVRWKSQYCLDFDVGFIHWEVQGAGAKMGAAALKLAIRELIPLGGIINAIGTIAVNRAVTSAGLAKLGEWTELSGRGVDWAGSHASLRLQAQPELGLLWAEPDGIPGATAVAGLLGVGSRLVDQFEVTGMRASREGLLLKAKLSEPAEAGFRAAAATYEQLATTARTDGGGKGLLG